MTRMFVPGPVDVADDVLQAQARPMLPHRSKEFEATFRLVAEKAQPLFGTSQRVFLTASSGSGLQEAAVRNLVEKKVLVCVNGAFSERWQEVALANGKHAEALPFAWEEPVDPLAVGRALQSGQYEAVLVVHNETSTGLQNPVERIAAAARDARPEVLVVVDAVSSLGGVAIEMDRWGLDMVLTSSQKCIALPPGLALAAVSDRAMHKAEHVGARGWYFDFLRLEKHRLKDSTPATPAMSLIFALDAQLDRMRAEGLENRFGRHAAMARRVQDWAASHGQRVFAPAGFRSETVTTIHNDHGLDISRLNAFLLERGMRIANGYGPLKNVTYRIATMGETQLEDVEALLAAIELFLGRPAGSVSGSA